jgi:hypothetical protein
LRVLTTAWLTPNIVNVPWISQQNGLRNISE